LTQFTDLEILMAKIISLPPHIGLSRRIFPNQLSVDVTIFHVFFHLQTPSRNSSMNTGIFKDLV